MSRCSICDYSQSADSVYFNSLAIDHSLSNNRVVYSTELRKDICIACLEEHLVQQNFWASIEEMDGNDTLLSTEEIEGHNEYCGCTSFETD